MKEQKKLEMVAGYLIGENGKPICPGVNCRCQEKVFCPMHGMGEKNENNIVGFGGRKSSWLSGSCIREN